MSKTFALVAGESSGDVLGAGLIDALRRQFPDAKFVGVGGSNMAAAGCEIWQDCEALAVMGIAEVLGELPRLLRLRRQLARRLIQLQPDCFIGIDAPDFNLGLEKRLKRSGIKTVHYVSPSIWAWRQKRAQTIGDSADRVLTLFPFEPAIYQRFNVDAQFVGHPTADRMSLDPNHLQAREHLGLDPELPCIALLPGSRGAELKRIGPPMLEAAAILANTRSCQFVFAAATEQRARQFAALKEQYAPNVSITTVTADAASVMRAATVGMIASGTATLEALFCKLPMVVVYKVARLTDWLVRRTGRLKIDLYSLPNVLAQKEIVPELMQEAFTPQSLADEVVHWLDNPERMDATKAAFSDIHLSLKRGASEHAAQAISELLS